MDKKLKAKWVKALRSGKYQQGYAELKVEDDDGNRAFCCLGVLRDIAHPRSTLEDPNEYILHERHEKAFGLNKDLQRELAAMNDGRSGVHGKADVKKHTFAEIADYIETHL